MWTYIKPTKPLKTDFALKPVTSDRGIGAIFLATSNFSSGFHVIVYFQHVQMNNRFYCVYERFHLSFLQYVSKTL